jgi:hypothetical protein
MTVQQTRNFQVAAIQKGLEESQNGNCGPLSCSSGSDNTRRKRAPSLLPTRFSAARTLASPASTPTPREKQFGQGNRAGLVEIHRREVRQHGPATHYTVPLRRIWLYPSCRAHGNGRARHGLAHRFQSRPNGKGNSSLLFSSLVFSRNNGNEKRECGTDQESVPPPAETARTYSAAQTDFTSV